MDMIRRCNSSERISHTDKINELLQMLKCSNWWRVLGLEAMGAFTKAKCNVTVLEMAQSLIYKSINKKSEIFNIIKGTGIDLKLNVKIGSIEGLFCYRC